MWSYIVRRILLTIPTVIGVLVLTFFLFSVLSKDPARAYAGKQPSETLLREIRHKMGVDKPRFVNPAAVGSIGPDGKKRGLLAFFDSQFFDLLFFRFHGSMRYEESIWNLFATRGPISLAIQLPAFFILTGLELIIALVVANRRGSAFDITVTIIAVLGMSIPTLSIYLAAQWFFGAKLKVFPVAGWEQGFYAIRFAALPILCTIFSQLGYGARFYRTVVLDEINSDYVRTARAKGVNTREVLLTHVIRNVMIPVITQTITALPFLLFGALILEAMFQIPGLGGLLVEAIFSQDHNVVMALTYLTA